MKTGKYNMTTEEAMRELLSEPMPADTEGRMCGRISFRRLSLKMAISEARIDYLLLLEYETRKDFRNVPDILEQVFHYYKETWADLFDIASKVTPDSKAILLTGALCFTIKDQPSIAKKFYLELARQLEMMGDKEESEKYKKAADDLLCD